MSGRAADLAGAEGVARAGGGVEGDGAPPLVPRARLAAAGAGRRGGGGGAAADEVRAAGAACAASITDMYRH